MKSIFRCKCPITSALDIVGDRWTLVIIKQMLLEQKSTFKDFTESQEFHPELNIYSKWEAIKRNKEQAYNNIIQAYKNHKQSLFKIR